MTLAIAVSACSSTDDGTDADVTAVPDAPVATEPTDAPAATSDSSVAGSAEDTTTEPSTAGERVVPEALRFTAPLVGGGEFDGAAYADKPTVFWFWAPT